MGRVLCAEFVLYEARFTVVTFLQGCARFR